MVSYGYREPATERGFNILDEGTVKWFNSEKGYGFITRKKQGDDIFVHYKSIVGEGRKDLNDGDNVQFDVENGPKGMQAVNVSKI